MLLGLQFGQPGGLQPIVGALELGGFAAAFAAFKDDKFAGGWASLICGTHTGCQITIGLLEWLNLTSSGSMIVKVLFFCLHQGEG